MEGRKEFLVDDDREPQVGRWFHCEGHGIVQVVGFAPDGSVLIDGFYAASRIDRRPIAIDREALSLPVRHASR